MKHRVIAAGLAGLCLCVGQASGPTPAAAQTLGAPVTNLLSGASDSALDKLARPGAFYADEAVRIGLPGPLKKASGIMKLTDQAGLTNGLTKSLNDAAGVTAEKAKPIFRRAIKGMTLKSGVDIASKGDGATRYLRDTSGSELKTEVRPLVANALVQVGAFKQLDSLSAKSSLLSQAGLSRESLTDSVTDQAMNGIFKYMGDEERSLRANPLGAGKKLLKGVVR